MSGTNLEMYGRNPYFLTTSSMYDPGLDPLDYYTAEEEQVYLRTLFPHETGSSHA
jgi:hypothetical protein